MINTFIFIWKPTLMFTNFHCSSFGHNNFSLDEIKKAIRTFANGYICKNDIGDNQKNYNCFNYSMFVRRSYQYY